ncbi:MAG: zinc-ribbon domain-containing protein [Oribacterium sp.]|nr:zinc-ribbon domain-containing protein [Oribacterium sp.]
MKHYKNLMSALGDAMPVCLAWRLAGTEDNFFNARDLFAFALSDEEEEGSLKEGQFYVVSSEGAIGISSGYEYFVRWLFIPLEGNVYDQEVMRLKQELENDTKPQPVPQSEPQPNMQPQGMGQPGIQPRGMSQSNMQVQGTGQSNVPPQGMPQYNGQPQAYEQSQGMGQSNVPPQGMPQPNVNPQYEEQPRIMPQAGKRQFCIQCGYKLGPNSKFCPGCGAPVNR